MKKIGIVVIACIAALSLMLVGCGSSSKKLVKEGTLTVLTNPEYEPFEFIEGDQIVGYDMVSRTSSALSLKSSTWISTA